MRIYENVMIGNFIYALGFAFGRAPAAMHLQPLSVNLLQQTPLDKPFGDVLLGGIRLVRLIEFKRLENKDDKEENKREMLRRTLVQNPHLIEISREIHWFFMIDGAETKASAYIDGAAVETTDSMIRFIETLVDEFQHGPIEDTKLALCREYLKLISLPQGTTTTSAGGMAFFVNSDGTLSYVMVENLRDLSMSLANIASNIQQNILQRDPPQQHLSRSQTHQFSQGGRTL